ncbi:MAG: hypothetical protein R6V85_17395 [Polyangia bacterium]
MTRFASPLLLASLLAACRQAPEPPRVEPITTPIPEESSRRTPLPSARLDAGQEAAEESSPLPDPEKVLERRGSSRFAVPGSVRWSIEMRDPITFIEWTPLAGLLVSTGSEVHNVTSWGQDRWRFVAGENHEPLVANGEQLVWSPEFERLTKLERWGRTGWQLDWHGRLLSDSGGGFFLVDAATVSAVGGDGELRWRVNLEGLRRLAGPFPCREGTLFQGIRGVKGVAVMISRRGAVMRETPLDRRSVVLGSSPACEPLVWSGGEISLLDARGLPLWQHEIPRAPLVRRLADGFLLASGDAQAPLRVTFLEEDGTVSWSESLPVEGRLTDLTPFAADGSRPRAYGLCLDVSSPCARPEGDRGPYNALVTSDDQGEHRVLTRHVKGHLDLEDYPGGGLVIASSSEAERTEVTRRAESGTVLWQVTLPGRLSAGPYVGPSGEVYVATCEGWSCAPPYRLVALTGRPPEADGD